MDPIATARDAAGRDRGLPVRREGHGKLTGAARFTDDLVVPGAWFGATVRAAVPRARRLAVDLDPGFDWGGVVVLRAADIPGENVIDGLEDDQPALASDEIRHVAQAVALVAAPSRALARAAVEAVRVRAEPLPAMLDPLAATHVFRAIEIESGILEAGFAAADLVLEGEYRTQAQEQLYLEPQAMVAAPRADGGIDIDGSMQCPFSVRAAVARVLGLAPDRVTVRQAETGGGFGGKEDYPSVIAAHAALLAVRAGRPVRIAYDRAEDLRVTPKRHPSIVRHRTGVSRDGRLVAQDIEVVLDGGAFATVSPLVLGRAAVHAGGPYRCPNVRIRARAVATDTPPNGAFRGFGGPQVQFAAEMHLNRLAEALGLSPAEIRRRNAYRDDDITPTGQRLGGGVGAMAALEAVVDRGGLAWEAAPTPSPGAPPAGAGPRIATGTGLAMAWHGAGLTGQAEARLGPAATVELTRDGRILGHVATTEMGQGARTVLAQVLAEALGVAPDDVEVAAPDTARVPDTGPTVASRSTMLGGHLLATAAARLRAAVEEAAGSPFAVAWREQVRLHGPLTVTERFGGFPGATWDEATFRGDAYPAYSWSAVAATVDVDLDTGEVAVRRIVHAIDAGRIVHPVLAEGQVEGGTLQAVGWAVLEDAGSTDGRLRADRLATYLVPTALDAPRVETVLVGQRCTSVPHGAKGIGELPMDAPAPAILAAIHDATGAWLTELPATPERVQAVIGHLGPAGRR